MTFADGQVKVPTTAAGPIPVLINDLTQMARSWRAGPGAGDPERLLHDQLHQAAAVPLRRRATSPISPTSSTSAVISGA